MPAEARVKSAAGRGAAGWPRWLSSCCAVAGAACLWAWGYIATLSTSLFPDVAVQASIGIEYSFYVSQLTLPVTCIATVLVVRRWHPALPPAAVPAASLLLAGTTLGVAVLLRDSGVSPMALALCGVPYGVGGMVLSVAWGARYSLGSNAMRRMVLLSFLLAYVLYFLSRCIPHGAALVVAVALPLVSGGLWLLDSWRRHLLTDDVWPSVWGRGAEGARRAGDERLLGEVSEGSTSMSILPWKSVGLFAVAAFLGNFVASFVMGSTYGGASTIFPVAFWVCAGITLVAVALVGGGARRLSVERMYRYALPVGVAGMLAITVFPDRGLGFSGALVTGVSLFLQVLITLKMTEATQETGVSPMLSFAVGQGVIGGVVFAGNVLGRAVSAYAGEAERVLPLACAIGVFVLFYLLSLVTDDLSLRLEGAGAPSGPPTGASTPGAVQGLGSAPAGTAAAPADPDLAGPGPSVADGEAAERVFARDAAAFAERHALTPRESDVLALLLRGRTLASIAERLFVTAGTVKTHALHIYRKTGVGSRQELLDLFERETHRG